MCIFDSYSFGLVLIATYSLQKLSADLVKSSECLRIWGLGEGNDLAVRLGFSYNMNHMLMLV